MISIAISGKRDEKIMRNVPTQAPYYKLRCFFAPDRLFNFAGELESTHRSPRVLWLVDEWEHQNQNLSGPHNIHLIIIKIIIREICILFVYRFTKPPCHTYKMHSIQKIFYKCNDIIYNLKKKLLPFQNSTPFWFLFTTL